MNPVILALLLAGSVATAAAQTYEVFAIRYATLPQFKVSGLIAGVDTSRRLDIAMMVWLLKGSNGRVVLVDAGFKRQDLIDRWKPADYQLPSAALEKFGVKADVVTDIIVSHIHWDHFDGADLFPKAKIWLQKDEFTYYLDSTGKSLRSALDGPDAAMLFALNKAGRVQLVDGDAKEIIPGITVYIGGKHTFQSQFAGVRTSTGTVVVASDNAYLYENLEKRRPIAQTLDSVSNLAAHARMRTIASPSNAIVPGHDPLVFSRYEQVAPGVVRISALAEGKLPESWAESAESCGTAGKEDFRLHEYNADFYILRQSGCTNYEKPFLYLLFGEREALLLDSGARGAKVAAAVSGALQRWASSHGGKIPKLTVAHSHSHGDHIAGDAQLAALPDVTVVGTKPADVQKFFNLANWPDEAGTYDLGGRVLDIVPIPGHEAASIAVYDRRTGALLTGDTMYPGRLYVADGAAFAKSARRLVDFTANKPIAHVLGAHIEQSRTPFLDYVVGTKFQPNEHTLALSRGQLLELLDGVNAMGGTIVRRAMSDFTIWPVTR